MLCLAKQPTIYVSRFNGNDSMTCGGPNSPCHSISYAIHKASEWSLMYLDGTRTLNDPYDCRSLNHTYSGMYLTMSMSFIGFRSRAYISCIPGNQWSIEGVQRKNGLIVSFFGIGFLATTLHFVDVTVNMNDILFTGSTNAAINFTVPNLPVVSLNLINVTFQQNTQCISVASTKKTKILLRITNSTFSRNGHGLSASASILWFNTRSSFPDIQFRNCSFRETKSNELGIIFVENKQGSTDFLLDHFKLEDNGYIESVHRPRIPTGLITIISQQVVMTLEFGSVSRTYGTFLVIDVQALKMDISNINIEKFYSSYQGGGVINITSSESTFLSIKDSSFRNGKSVWFGGVASLLVQGLKLTVQNSIIENISSVKCGGAVWFKSNDLQNSSYETEDFVTEMEIINSTFINNFSTNGGVLCTSVVGYLIANITDCVFIRNGVAEVGAALLVNARKAAVISLHKVHFIENSAGVGGIVHIICTNRCNNVNPTCNFTSSHVRFVKNKLGGKKKKNYGILELRSNRSTSVFALENAHFVENSAPRSALIFLRLSRNITALHSVIIETCMFKKNYADYGVLRLYGHATLILKHLIIDSNVHTPCLSSTVVLIIDNPEITMLNSTFVNNSCGGIAVHFLSTTGYFKIENSTFVGNRRVGRPGAAIAIFVRRYRYHLGKNSNGPRKFYRNNALIHNVWFEENYALSGSVVEVENGNMEILNCVFLNNFARFPGGQIGSYGLNNLKISHSILNATGKAKFINRTEFKASAFLRIHSRGELQILNTTATSNMVSDEPLILITKAKNVTMDTLSETVCPRGSAIMKRVYDYIDSSGHFTVLDMSCQKCPHNYYSLERGHAKGLNLISNFVCFPCPRGANCISSIKSKTNFWGYHTRLSPPKLAFTICPFGYCKSPESTSSNYNECEGNRTGIMCGMCSNGHTETLLSTYCTPTENCGDNLFWFVYLGLIIFMAILLVFKPPIVKYSLKQVLWLKRLVLRSTNTQNREYHTVITRTTSYDDLTNEIPRRSSIEQNKHEKRQFARILEIVFYFYQIAQLLLSSYSLDEYFDSKFLSPILGFFNFQPTFNKSGSFCPFPGLTPRTKFLLKVAPVFGTLVAIFVIYVLNLIINKFRGTFHPSIPSYLQASIKTVFLGYVTLATVSISLVRCVSIAGESRWFYNGNVICYQWWQYGSFMFIGTFAIPFIFFLAWTSLKIQHGAITVKQFLIGTVLPLPVLLFWLLRRIYPIDERNMEESENRKALKEMLLGPYKNPCESQNKYFATYWQSFLMARRLILVVLYCTLTEPSTKLFCMTFLCVLVLCAHLLVKPFRNWFANGLESISLLFLVIIGLMNLSRSAFIGIEENIKGPLVTVFNVFQWIEFVILGLFPAALSILICLALFSLMIRVLFTSCRCAFKLIFRPRSQTGDSGSQTDLLNICAERY